MYPMYLQRCVYLIYLLVPIDLILVHQSVSKVPTISLMKPMLPMDHYISTSNISYKNRNRIFLPLFITQTTTTAATILFNKVDQIQCDQMIE